MPSVILRKQVFWPLWERRRGNSLEPSRPCKVTSLDAVSTNGRRSAKLKVAGLVAKVSDAHLDVPTGEIIDTKGSTDILRSGGVGGKSTVAAMERGGTGLNNVEGMVTANLSKTVRIKGGMKREEVKRVIDQHMGEVSYCYETALASNPDLAGKIVFEWKILLSGKVGEVSIKSSSVSSGQLHACIRSAIKSWQFPQPKGSDVYVSYPFIFDVVGF